MGALISSFIQSVQDRPKTVIFLVLLITALFFIPLTRIEIDIFLLPPLLVRFVGGTVLSRQQQNLFLSGNSYSIWNFFNS